MCLALAEFLHGLVDGLPLACMFNRVDDDVDGADKLGNVPKTRRVGTRPFGLTGSLIAFTAICSTSDYSSSSSSWRMISNP